MPSTTSGAAGKTGEHRTQHELASLVLRDFRQVFNAVKLHFQQVEKTVGLGGAQVWALAVIGDAPGLRVTELARAMDIRQSTASNLVRSLSERGLVQAVKDSPDKRVVSLRLTGDGSGVLASAPGPFEGVLPNALRQMDEASLRRMHADLGLLVARLNAEDGGAQVPLAEM